MHSLKGMKIRKFAAILGNLGNTFDRFCGGYKDNPSSMEMLRRIAQCSGSGVLNGTLKSVEIIQNQEAQVEERHYENHIISGYSGGNKHGGKSGLSSQLGTRQAGV